MNNFKKIGLTALAASLVSVSAHAGALTASGSASMNTEGHTGEQLDAGTTFSMSNSVTLSGSGEMDNGLTVSVSFEMDHGPFQMKPKQLNRYPFHLNQIKLHCLTLRKLYQHLIARQCDLLYSLMLNRKLLMRQHVLIQKQVKPLKQSNLFF